MKLRALLLAASVALSPLAAQASNLTPDQLTQATSLNSTDLMVIYPSGGPMKSVQWGVVQSLMQTFLGGQYLQISNNLSDLVSAPAARSNLGLGNASVQNIGTSGAALCLLNTACTFSGLETFSAGLTVSGGSVTLPSNSLAYSYLPYTPVNKAGDTMTGSLTAQLGVLLSNTVASNTRAILYQTSSSGTPTRWTMNATNEAETGSNAGSNWELQRFGDNGVVIDDPIFVNRATGTVFIQDSLNVTGQIFGTLSGNALTASKLATARTISLTGAITGTCPSFDGSANISCSTTQVAGPSVAEFNEQESAGTNSSLGSIGATTWTQEPLNATVGNTISGASLSSNTITLPAGTYQIHGYAVARAGSGSMLVARLRNLTSGGTYQGVGVTFGPSSLNTIAPFQATFTIAVPSAFDVNVWTQSGVLASGGFAVNTGATETYTDIQIVKVS